MKKFILKLFLISLPVIMIFSLFVYYNPNDYFYLRKEDMSGNIAATIRHYAISEPDHIILGTSRFQPIDLDRVEELTGKEYCNLAFGASDFSEIAELFWFAVERNENLESVVMETGFYILRDIESESRITYLINNLNYFDDVFYDPNNWKTAYNIMVDDIKSLFGVEEAYVYAEPEAVNPSENDIYVDGYRMAMVNTTDILYNAFRDYHWDVSEVKLAELTRIVNYCNENNIEITLVMPPMADLLWDRLLLPFDYDEKMAEYTDHLSTLTTCYSFELRDSGFTADEYAFYDALHLYDNHQQDLFTELIFGDDSLREEYSDYLVVSKP